MMYIRQVQILVQAQICTWLIVYTKRQERFPRERFLPFAQKRRKADAALELYIHIPFCVKKCAYCDFLSGPAGEKEKEEYVKMLVDEIRNCPDTVQNYRVISIFFGGGTPSLLTGEQIGRLMDTVREIFTLDEDAEITMEMNPGTVTEEKLRKYRQAGVNRLSIGLQSVNDEELRLLGRIHTYEEFREAYHLARANGFSNINVDLISAIPGQTVESWRRTLEQVMALSPEHISAYSLILEEGTTFYKKYVEDEAKEGPKLPDEDAERQMYWDTETLMEKNGYHRYEISNYAKEGYACRHNLGYWERIPYLGFGIGAASLVPGDLIGKCRKLEGKMSRYTNPDQLREYAHSYRNKFQAELLTETEEMEEFMFLGLRKMNGISKKEFSEYFGKSLEDIYGEPICKLESLKLLEQDDDRVWLTKRGIDVSNSVFVEFLLEE